MLQTKHSLRRNYPILAHIRFMLEKIRPEIRQYFLESDTDGTPFNRAKRAIVYQRAKGQLDKRPFGTQQDIYGNNFEWINHSLVAGAGDAATIFRVTVGGPDCKQPYSLSLFNISAMSFGSLSANAIRALNKGAKLGNFAHDTGEGGFSRYHQRIRRRHHLGDRQRLFRLPQRRRHVLRRALRRGGGRAPGQDDRDQAVAGRQARPRRRAAGPEGDGGDFRTRAACRSASIASRRRRHSAFSTPLELVHFIAKLRELSGGKPVGFKLCIGHPWEFMGICKAMLETGIRPDFIVIDGTEGGTGAAPLEFVDHIGTPMREGLMFAHNCLVGAGLRDTIRLGVAGRIITGFDMARVLALGADWCNAARGFMFALGCVQAQSCHTDHCPSGVATQNPWRQRALVVPDKAERVRRFHDNTLAALADLIGAAGLTHPKDLTPMHLLKRVSAHEVKTFAELYTFIGDRELLAGTGHATYAHAWNIAHARRFTVLPEVKATADAQGQAA